MKRRQLKKLCKKAAEALRDKGCGEADFDYYDSDEEFKVHGYWECSYENPSECDFVDAWCVLQQHFFWDHADVDNETLDVTYTGPKQTTRNMLRWASAQATNEKLT